MADKKAPRVHSLEPWSRTCLGMSARHDHGREAHAASLFNGTPVCSRSLFNAMPAPDELDQAQRVLDACGLRFDGYAYAESRIIRGQDATDWLVNLRDTFIHTLAVLRDIEAAHAVLFAFQRGAKELGWFLDRSAFSLAGPLLFLHLYTRPTPPRWRFSDDAAEWERFSSEEIETAAATVRRWLAVPEEP